MSSVPLEIRMGRLEGAYEQISKRLDSIDARLDRLDAKIDALHLEVTTNFRWLVGMIFGTWVTTILAIFFHR
ncbi:MAG: hypothetical protein JO024_02730 [Candidatus Eremiobacteraeota bacterium]|nr:hypothetical protein [Candidatus Eremiobacteraeota bacterium]